MAIIEIPSLLRKYVNHQEILQVPGGALLDTLTAVTEEYPQLKTNLLSDESNLHPFVNLYVNGQDIRFLDNLSTVILDTDIVAIVPATAGG